MTKTEEHDAEGPSSRFIPTFGGKGETAGAHASVEVGGPKALLRSENSIIMNKEK